MKKRDWCLAVLAFALILTAVGRGAWAYFTTFAEARGGYPISLGDETRVKEEFSAWTKHVTITVSEDSEPVFVRAKAFCGSRYSLVYSDAGGKWTPGGEGYYYYSDPVAAGGSTDVLDIKIENVPSDVKDSESFHVVVIYETTPVLYQEDGTAYADWTRKVDGGTVKGGGA